MKDMGSGQILAQGIFTCRVRKTRTVRGLATSFEHQRFSAHDHSDSRATQPLVSRSLALFHHETSSVFPAPCGSTLVRLRHVSVMLVLSGCWDITCRAVAVCKWHCRHHIYEQHRSV